MTGTITPAAVDAYVYIESIRVEGRFRKDLGDLVSLQRSIRELGYLLHPIVITPDARLVAGQRRLEACRRLGWVEVPVRIARSLDDASLLLRAELEENTERKEMLPSELAALGEALHEIEGEHARERQRAAGRENGRGIASAPRSGSYSAGGREAREAVAEALGMGASTYSELRFAHRLAHDPDAPGYKRELARTALDEMDQTGHIKKPGERLRARLHERQAEMQGATSAPDPEPAAPAFDELWVPALRDNGLRAAEQRRHLIRHYGAKGYTSLQIGELTGLRDQTIRKIARDAGIEIQADVALGVRTRKTVDSNRVVRETAATLDGLVTGVGLVDVAALDPAEIDDWVRSLTTSIRALNRLIKQMKERTQ